MFVCDVCMCTVRGVSLYLSGPGPPMLSLAPPEWCAVHSNYVLAYLVVSLNVMIERNGGCKKLIIWMRTNHSIYTYCEYACFYGSYFVGYND